MLSFFGTEGDYYQNHNLKSALLKNPNKIYPPIPSHPLHTAAKRRKYDTFGGLNSSLYHRRNMVKIHRATKCGSHYGGASPSSSTFLAPKNTSPKSWISFPTSS